MARSMSFATTAVAMSTPTTIELRCQAGMAPISTARGALLRSRGQTPASAANKRCLSEGLPARESLFRPVPVRDLVLAELPAEQDVLAVPPGREVDQPFADV